MKPETTRIAALLLVTLVTGCTISTSTFKPVGRSSTTGGIVCPNGYEPTGDGSCQPIPNASIDRDAFR